MYSINMIQGVELTYDNFNKAAILFKDLNHHISIQGVITGKIIGRIFLANDSKSAMLKSPQGIFLGGSPANILFFEEVNRLLANEILPSLVAIGKLDYVLFYSSDNQWKDSLEIIMKDLLPMRSGRMTFTHDLKYFKTSLDDSIVQIDSQFLKRQDLIGLDEVIKEILEGWCSIEAYEKNGFGCAAIQATDEGLAVISWCLTDWVVGTECELGIQTDEHFRRKGWARKTALGVLSLTKQRGITRIGWQCWSNNLGSQQTALSVGFKLLADFPVLFGWNSPLNNLLVNGNHYMRGDSKYGVAQNYSRSALSYVQALDKGWDWNGDVALYWNTACMFYLIGELERAKHYYKIAVEKGWKDIHQPHYHEHVYREADSEQIVLALSI